MTIAVDDLPRTVQIYENMGWQTPPKGSGVREADIIKARAGFEYMVI